MGPWWIQVFAGIGIFATAYWVVDITLNLRTIAKELKRRNRSRKAYQDKYPTLRSTGGNDQL